MGVRVCVIQQCKRSGEWLPTGIFAPSGKQAKAAANATKPICMFLHNGHCKAAMPDLAQMQLLYRQAEKGQHDLASFPRAAGGGGV
eukprot:13358612-Alexandrium_andersonii.AAC.1